MAAVLLMQSVSLALLGVHVFTPAPAAVPAAPAAIAAPTLRELQDGKPFRFVHGNRQHPIVRLMMLGFFEACRDLDVECVDQGVDGVDLAAIITRGEETLSLGSSGVIWPMDNQAFFAAGEKVAAQLPLVSIHVQTEIPGMYAWVSADGRDYAKRSADKFAELMNCMGTVQVTQGSFNETENPVTESFTARMAEVCPDVKVLPAQEEGFDSPAAIAKLIALMQANPLITAAYSTTGAGATNWAAAAKEMGKKPGEIIIAGMDYSRQNLDLVKSGEVAFLVGQPLYEELYKAVECLAGKLQGEPCPLQNPFPAPLIGIDDIDTYYGYNDRVGSLDDK